MKTSYLCLLKYMFWVLALACLIQASPTKANTPTPVLVNDPAAVLTPEIVALAHGLEYDPIRIFNHIHENFDVSPFPGIGKSAEQTMRDKVGNDFELSALMIALLRASGIEAKYKFGTQTYDAETYENISGLLRISFDEVSDSYQAERVWVEFTYQGETYQADPSFKRYQTRPPLNLKPGLQFNIDDFIAGALEGADYSSDFIRNLNTSNIRSALNNYTSNLRNYIEQNYSAIMLDDAIGKRESELNLASSLSDMLPVTGTILETWDTVPLEFLTTLNITYRDLDYTLLTTEISGSSLYITFNNSGQAMLMLDDEVLQTGQQVNSGTVSNEACITLESYRPGFDSNFRTRECSTFRADKETIISPILGAVNSIPSRESIQYYDSKQARLAKDDDPAKQSEAIASSLNSIGLNFARNKNYFLINALKIHGIDVFSTTALGWVVDNGSGVIDWPRNNIRYRTINNILNPNTSSITLSRGEILLGNWIVGSAFEAAVFDHIYGEGFGGSTVKTLDVQNSSGGKIYYLNAQNFNQIRPQLTNYSSTDLDRFKAGVDNGGWILLPENGSVPYLGSKLRGYIAYGTGDGNLNGYRFSADYNGGGGLLNQRVSPSSVAGNFYDYSENPKQKPIQTPGQCVGDPIDMLTGSYVKSKSDLVIGSGNSPLGLTLDRNYTSVAHDQRSSFGNGWSHNHDITLRKISNSRPIIGETTAKDAASLIVYSYIAPALLNKLTNCLYKACDDYETDLLGHMIINQMAKWYVDGTVENSYILSVGNASTIEFTRHVDGKYRAFEGINLILTELADGSVTIEERSGETLIFDTSLRIQTIQDIVGNETTYTYSGNNLTRIQDEYDRWISFDYVNDLITRAYDSAGREVRYEYDVNSNLVRITDIEGFVTQFIYDEQNRVISEIDGTGNLLMTNIYNVNDQVIQQSLNYQAGDSTIDLYFSGKKSIAITNNGDRTAYIYDDFGRTVGITDPLGKTTKRTYNAASRPTSSTDILGRVTEYEYDRFNNLVKQTDPLGNEIIFEYDNRQRLVKTTNSLGESVSQVWNDKNQITSIILPNGDTIAYTYDIKGRLLTELSPSGILTRYSYDDFGEVSNLRIGDESPTQFSFSSLGHRQSVTDGLNSTTEFSTDNRGLVITRIDVNGAEESFTYDANGNLLEETNRLNETTSYTYTPTKKLQSINFNDSTSVQYRYDILDNLIEIEDQHGVITYTYDRLNRVTSRTDTYGFTTSYTYTLNNQLSTIIYPGNKVVGYSYDKAGRLVKVKDWLGRETNYEYDEAGKLIQQSNFNRTNVIFLYDINGQLIRKTIKRSNDEIIADYQITLDKDGKRITINSNQPIPSVIEDETIEYTTNNTGDRLVSDSKTNYIYNDEGQLQTKGDTSFTFNQREELISISGDNVSSFVFDAEGKRISRVVNSEETRMIYDNFDNLIAIANAQNEIQEYFVYGIGLHAQINSSGKSYQYHFDYNANTIGLTDNNEELVNRYAYSPFGKIINQDVTITNPFTFVGQYGVYQELDNFYHMRARMYDADSGRFISKDPLGFDSGDVNLMTYAANNPISNIDPNGYMSLTNIVYATVPVIGYLIGDKALKVKNERDNNAKQRAIVLDDEFQRLWDKGRFEKRGPFKGYKKDQREDARFDFIYKGLMKNKSFGSTRSWNAAVYQCSGAQ